MDQRKENVNLCSLVKHFGSWPKGQDLEYMEMSFSPGVAGLILGDRGDELNHPRGAPSGAALPLRASSSWTSLPGEAFLRDLHLGGDPRAKPRTT